MKTILDKRELFYRIQKNRLFPKQATILLFLIFFVSISASAQNGNSRYKLEFGLFGETHLHASDFRSLPDIPSCCPQYKSAFGFGFATELGLNYSLDKIFERNSSIGLRVGYSYSAPKFSEDEFIGNVIFNDYYTNGISRHTIETQISRISLKPYFAIEPVSEFPINTYIGIGFSFTNSIHINQEERLISPAGATYENHQTTRNQFSENIKNLSNPNISLCLGLNYKPIEYKNLRFKPELNFNIGITNFVQSINWKANSINLGIVLEYNFAKPKPPAPLPAPLPELPPPEQPKIIALDFDLYHKNKAIAPYDTIFVVQTKTLEISTSIYPAILYYDYNRSDFRKNPNFDEIKFFDYISRQVLNQNQLTLVISASSDEDTNIINQRKQYILSKLSNYRIPSNKITFNTIIVNVSSLKYKELADESRYVKFVVPANSNYVEIKDTISSSTETEDINLSIKTKVQGTEKYTLAGKLYFNNSPIADFSTKEYNITLNNLLLNKNLLNLFNTIKVEENLESSDNIGISQQKLYYLQVIPKFYTKQKLQESKEKEQSFEQYFLGFFEFDGDIFYAVDTTCISRVVTAINDGKKVELIPTHDYFGDSNYNQNLMKRRLMQALKVLNISADKVIATYPKEYLFSNELPETRILNRSVIVRIYK